MSSPTDGRRSESPSGNKVEPIKFHAKPTKSHTISKTTKVRSWRINTSVKDLLTVIMYYNPRFTDEMVPDKLLEEAELGVMQAGNSDELAKLLNESILNDPYSLMCPGVRAFL